MLGISRGTRRGAVAKHVGGPGGEFANYYVDPAGSDAANGTSQATAWQTLAKVNAATLASGNVIRLKRGGTWRETLVPPRDTLQFGAYGTGADPVVSGADNVTSWTSEGGGSENFLDGAGSTPLSYWTLSETTGNRLDGKTAANNDLTPAGTNAVTRVTGPGGEAAWAAHFDGTNNLVATTASLSSAFPNKIGGTANPSAITMGGWFRVSATPGAPLMNLDGTAALFFESNAVIFTVFTSAGTGMRGGYETIATNTWVHVVGRWTLNGEVALFLNGSKQPYTESAGSVRGIQAGGLTIGGTSGWGFITGDAAMPFVFSSALSDGQIAAIAAGGLAGSGGGGSLFYRSEPDPGIQVFRNGSRLTRIAAKVNLAAGTFWWDEPNARVYVFDDPAGQTMEIGRREVAAMVHERTAVQIAGIEFAKAKRQGLRITGGSSAITVSSCLFNNNGQEGYAAFTRFGDSAMPDLTVATCTATHNGGSGIVGGSNVPRWMVSGCTAHHNCLDAERVGGWTANIRFAGEGAIGRLPGLAKKAPGGAVVIAAGASIQTAVNANPNGTAFKLSAGTYTGQTFQPKPNNAFYGEGAATLAGGGATRALNGQAISGVTVNGVTISGYAPPSQGIGVFGTDASSQDWTIEDCEITGQTTGHAVVLGTRMLIRNCYLHHNSHASVNCWNVQDAKIRNNEVSYNNTSLSATFGATGDVSGMKLTNSLRTIAANNYFHHNHVTHGLWFDIDCDDTIIEGNRFEDNGLAGLDVELDYGSITRNNFFARNNMALSGGFGGGGVYIQNAQNAQVSDNEFRGNGGAMWMYEDARGSGNQGTWTNQNNPITGNIITAALGKNGYNPATNGTTRGNTFSRNNYYLTGTAQLTHNDVWVSIADWRTAGQDTVASGARFETAHPVHQVAIGLGARVSVDVVVEDCTTYRGGYNAADAKVAIGNQGSGIWLDGPGTGSIVRRNACYDNAGVGVRVDYPGSGALIEYNVSYRNDQGIALARNVSTGVIRHNTAYGNRHNIWIGGQYGGGGGNTMLTNSVRDNIATAPTAGGTNLVVAWGADNAGSLGTGNTYTKNAFGTQAADFVRWGLDNPLATYAALDSAYGSAQNNITGNPLLNNPAAGDFTLQAGSPCLAAATDGGNIGAK